MALFGKKKPNGNANFETLLFPGEWELWVRGVRYHQDGLKQAGIGSCRFLLVPEPTNKVDKSAVAVLAVTKTGTALVGYLPAGEFIQTEFFAVGTVLKRAGWLAVVDGKIAKTDGQYNATLQMPKAAAVRARLDEWSKSR